jgi:small-conductance mechanosensitive channel
LSKAYYKLSTSNQFFSIASFVIIIILVLYFSWYALKDYVAGVVFKTSGDLFIGDNVRIDKYTGEIVKFAYRTLNLETIKGEIVYIPYSKITSNSIVKINLAEAIKSHTFKLIINKPESLVNTIENIKNSIINLPWSSVKKKPGVYTLDETQNNIILDITVYAIEEGYFYDIENYIKMKFVNIKE